MLCSLAKLNGAVARRGAVLIGRDASTLWVGPTEVLMAHSAWSARWRMGMSGGVLVIIPASGEGGARYVGVGRAWRTGMLWAWSHRALAWACRVVQGLALLGAGTVGGGGRCCVSQTRLARLVLPLAHWRHGGDNGALGMVTING